MGSAGAQRAPCESRDTLHACGGTVVSARSVLVNVMCVFVHQGVTVCFSLCSVHKGIRAVFLHVCVWLSQEDVRRGCSPTYLRP